ncbi:MAG TPA: DUF6232 family protein [Chloroflexia bacterium]|jgi:hypothetical protein
MSEIAYYHDNRALVTAQAVELEGETYSVADIWTAGLEQAAKPDLEWLRTVGFVAWSIFVIVVSLRLILPLLGQPVIGYNELGVALVLISMCTALFATITVDMLGNLYYVALEGTFGTVMALPSDSKRYVVRVASAIRQAMNETQEQEGKSRF